MEEFIDKDLIGLTYEQLLPYALPAENPENAFKVIAGDFVSTDEGTGIVHIAPTFGADDARVAKQAGVPAMLVMNEDGKLVPLVDLQGKFVKELEMAKIYQVSLITMAGQLQKKRKITSKMMNFGFSIF